MRNISRIALALGITVLIAGGTARADQTTSWPSEQEQQLATLDAQLIDLQQRLFTAKQTNDVDGTNTLTAQFNACEEQRMTLLRAMGLVTDTAQTN